MFETWNSILDYCLGPVPESCLPGVVLTPCFKVVLIVALSQIVTYLICDLRKYSSKEFKNAKLDKWQKMLLSLRSNPQTMSPYICKKAKLQARIKPTALCSVIDKENSIEFPLDFLHYLYNYYMVCALLSHTYHVTHHVTSCNVTLWLVWHLCCDMFLHFLLYSKSKIKGRKEKKI